jgi:hypothetical protein
MDNFTGFYDRAVANGRIKDAGVDEACGGEVEGFCIDREPFVVEVETGVVLCEA